MGRAATGTTLERTRAVGGPSRPTTFPPCAGREACPHKDRQHRGPLSYKPPGHYQVLTVPEADPESAFMSIRLAVKPGVRNTAADFLSQRRPHPSEWRLHPEVVQIIWHYYGRAEMDIFASQATTHCPLWFSLGESTSPLGQDALAHEWPRQLLYAFPPLPLILPTLDRIVRGHHRVLLVAPRWLGSVVSHTRRLLVGSRAVSPCRQTSSRSWGGQVWHPDPARLQLWVWPLRGPSPC